MRIPSSLQLQDVGLGTYCEDAGIGKPVVFEPLKMKWKSSLMVQSPRKTYSLPGVLVDKTGLLPSGFPSLMRYTDLYMMIKIQCHKLHKPESGMEEYILVTPGANRLH